MTLAANGQLTPSLDGLQVGTLLQLPLLQNSPDAQAWPHWPQFVTEVARSTHAEPPQQAVAESVPQGSPRLAPVQSSRSQWLNLQLVPLGHESGHPL